ncbi:hypothetical protein CFP56_015375, partial [Quercus suber]
VQQSLQLRSSHPMHGVLDEINENAGPYIGLVITFPTEELALIDSTFFVPSSEILWVDLAGTLSLIVQQSLQLRSSHPMHGVLDEINENAGPYIGLVITFPTEELALIDSTFFVPSSEILWVDLAGTLSLIVFVFFLLLDLSLLIID